MKTNGAPWETFTLPPVSESSTQWLAIILVSCVSIAGLAGVVWLIKRLGMVAIRRLLLAAYGIAAFGCCFDFATSGYYEAESFGRHLAFLSGLTILWVTLHFALRPQQSDHET